MDPDAPGADAAASADGPLGKLSVMIARFVANAAALALATWLIPGIVMHGGTYTQRAVTLVIVAAVFGVLNSLVKPIFEFFTG